MAGCIKTTSTASSDTSLNTMNQAREYHNTGTTLYEKGQYNEAITAFDKAIQLDKNLAEPWSGKGNALKALGRYQEAFLAYDNAIKINPKYARYNLFNCWSKSS